MTARSPQLAGPTPADTAWQWLRPAAEMAALLTGCWPIESSTRPAPGLTGWIATPLVATRTPAPTARSVARARAFTLGTLRRWGAGDCADDASVVVSELLTNALRHAVPEDPSAGISPVRIGLLHPGPCVMCAVADPSDQVPVLRETSWQSESGRGLHVVASLSASWGYCPVANGTGKVVWATVPTRPLPRLFRRALGRMPAWRLRLGERQQRPRLAHRAAYAVAGCRGGLPLG